MTLPPDVAAIPQGRYAVPEVLPGVQVVLEAGWSSGPVRVGTIELRRAAGAGEAIVALARLETPTAAAAAESISASPGITVLATSESRMSGRTGPNLELENATDDRLDLDGPLAIGAGERMWLSLFDTSAGVLAIAVRSPIADWDAALLAVEPFLEQVVIAD